MQGCLFLVVLVIYFQELFSSSQDSSKHFYVVLVAEKMETNLAFLVKLPHKIDLMDIKFFEMQHKFLHISRFHTLLERLIVNLGLSRNQRIKALFFQKN